MAKLIMIRLVVTVLLLGLAAHTSGETAQRDGAVAWTRQPPGGAVSRQGTHAGALYLIEIPANWNGGLVLYAHGIEGDGPGMGSARVPPLASHLAGNGYAWAASGYRARGYRPDWFVDDMLALRELFIREFGPPRWAVIYGQSMGGHIAVASLELHPAAYQGAFVECGLVNGIAEADFLYAYTAAAEYISGIPLLDAPNAEAFWELVNGPWLRVMGQPGAYTERGRRFDSIVKYLMGGDLPFRVEGLKSRYLMNLGLRLDPERETQPARRAVSTLHVRYRIDPGLGLTEEELNATVRRFAPARGARSPAADPVFAEFTAGIRVPLMTLHNTGDGWVPFAHQQDYRRKAIAAGTGHLLVQRAVRWPGHCNFEGEDREQAFDDLVRWMETGVKPDGDDVLGDPSRLGLRWTPMLHPADPARK